MNSGIAWDEMLGIYLVLLLPYYICNEEGKNFFSTIAISFYDVCGGRLICNFSFDFYSSHYGMRCIGTSVDTNLFSTRFLHHIIASKQLQYSVEKHKHEWIWVGLICFFLVIE
jgi:hypothetical protein